MHYGTMVYVEKNPDGIIHDASTLLRLGAAEATGKSKEQQQESPQYQSEFY